MTISSAISDEALQSILIYARMNRPIGIIVTEPGHLKTAEQFGVDIVPMFNQPEQALLVAQEISEASDSFVVVIRSGDAHSD